MRVIFWWRGPLPWGNWARFLGIFSTDNNRSDDGKLKLSLSRSPRLLDTKKNEKDNSIIEMGAVRLELTKTEAEGFTVPCNCHYATPPRRKEKSDAGERTWTLNRPLTRRMLYHWATPALRCKMITWSHFYDNQVYITGFGGSSVGTFGAEARWKKREETFEVPWVSWDWGAAEESTVALIFLCFSFISQHFLYFFPDPQGQGSFLPTLDIRNLFKAY